MLVSQPIQRISINLNIRCFQLIRKNSFSAIYSAEVNESAPIGSIVITIQATDKDAGNNSRISYSIIDANVSTLAVLTSCL